MTGPKGYDVVGSKVFICICMNACATAEEDQSLGSQTLEAWYIPIVAGTYLQKKR
jgi:hypothetical protein